MKIFRHCMLTTTIFISTAGLTACNAQTDSSKNLESKQATETSSSTAVSSSVNQTYKLATMTQFNEPWAMTGLKDGRLLVTERKGKLQLFDPQTKQKTEVKGMPKVAYGGQGGLGDIALHPQFAQNHIIYLSYAEAGQEGYGAVVARGELDLSNSQKPQVKNLTTIWQQVPKVQGQGHYAHRLLFGQDGKLWVS